MTQKELNDYRALAALGILEDERNPIFIFSGLRAELLLDIVSGKIDPIQMARLEMRNRGLDLTTGKWIGWSNKTTSDVLV